MREALRNQKILKFWLEGVAQEDIGRKFGLDQSVVCRAIKKEYDRTSPERALVIEQARELAVAQCYAHVSNHAARARTDAKASELVLAWMTRADKVQGLYSDTHRLELSGANGRALRGDQPPYDFSRLDTDDLATLERVLMKAAGTLPPPDEPREIVTMPKETERPVMLIEDHRPAPVVAEYAEFIPKPTQPSLIEEILRLKAQGVHPYDISDRLGITRSALDAAVEKHNTQRLNAS
jgi:hypothetical protein